MILFYFKEPVFLNGGGGGGGCYIIAFCDSFPIVLSNSICLAWCSYVWHSIMKTRPSNILQYFMAVKKDKFKMKN